ncbi:unnamed protein product [Owenia fusiformis]|uniref:Uncharacterized protein n=1 Tax=Owenia fusiformis TaxID=6347 RepID=A0A8J1TWD8_OWEFU|nr:unnamed protein product [Owenia fusiformis]
MDTMKEWIAMKCNKTNKSPTNQQKLSPVRTQFAQVVTPENIPDFIIPPKVNYLATTPEEVDHPQQFSFNGIEDTQQPFNDFEKTSYSNNLQLPSRMNLPTTIRKYRSAPPSPCKTSEAYMISEKGTLSDGHLENLDIFSEDSFSISALTIPYLRTKTSYGFSTLSESPHTRRKESLFHNGTVSRPMKSLKNDRREFTSCDTVGGVSVGKLSLPIGHPLVRAASCNCRPSSLLAPKAPRNIGSDGNGSDSSLGSTPSRLSMSPVSSTHSTPEIPRKQKVNKIASRTERYYYRRRSSLKNLESGKPAEKCQCGCGGVVSDCSSVEPSPLQVRRKSNDGLSKRDTNHIQSQLNAHATSTSIQKSASQNSKLESGLNRLTSVEDRSIADRGELKFAVKYDPKIEILTVNVLKAENLSLKNKSEQVVNSCVKCYLLPGKQQKQVTHVIQQTNNPIFNQQFIFTAIDREEIANMKLCLRVLHKTPALKRSEFIGEVVLPLKSTQDEEEVRLWRYLQAHNDTQVLLY